jgi:hypothetical protein
MVSVVSIIAKKIVPNGTNLANFCFPKSLAKVSKNRWEKEFIYVFLC